jgi:vitamin B12 transporter
MKSSIIKTTIVLLVLLASVELAAQIKIQGTATYNQVNGLADVEIILDGTYDGAKTNPKGKFEFETTETGQLLIIAQKAGYQDVMLPIEIKEGEKRIINLDIIFTIKVARLKEITVNAPIFASTDKNRATPLKPLDILTTATDGNITSALKTLPGAQQIGESGDLFIRGGTGNETKTFIDGMLVNNFNYSSTANTASRSRFPPGLFKGTFFSSGGYSAEYGQALSATLILESDDIPIKSSAEFTITPIWLGANVNVADKEFKQSIGGSINYTNLKPIFSVLKPKIDFEKKPEFVDASFYWRHKIRQNGIIKFFGSMGNNNVGIINNNLDFDNVNDIVNLKSKNIYTNLTYKETLKKGWKVFAGASYSQNTDDLHVKAMQLYENKTVFDSSQTGYQTLGQLKVVITKNIFAQSKLKFGTEHQFSKETDQINKVSTTYDINERFFGNFVELDSYLSEKLTVRAGLRAEHSSILNKWNLAPRASIGYAFSKNTLLSYSAGQFYQKPETKYIARNFDIGYTKATHHIISLQKSDSYQTFRIEGYHKNYNNLLKTAPSINTEGSGFAKGLELFWRDKKTLKEFDYWLSYSLLDTKRNFMDYPISTQPNFAAKHTVSAVLKRFFPDIATNISTTYTFATGRPYYNPKKPASAFMSDKTINYNNLGFSIAYLPKIKNTFTVLVLTVSNVLGNSQIYNYQYSNTDFTKRRAIEPVSNPFIFLGLIINMGVDRTQDVINKQF